MPSWFETAKELTEPIPEMADSLKTELQELSDIKCVHFEALTKRMGPKGNQPKSVDCMGTSKIESNLRKTQSNCYHLISEHSNSQIISSTFIRNRTYSILWRLTILLTNVSSS